MKVFITGGAGFIGSHVVHYCIEKGVSAVKLYDNLTTGNPAYIEQVLSTFGEYAKTTEENTTQYTLSARFQPVGLTGRRGGRGEGEGESHNPGDSDHAGPKNADPLLITLVQADILDFDALCREMSGFDCVIHLAAHTRVVESLENPRENIDINTTGTFNAIEAARRNTIKRFIFASSNAAVGEQVPPVHETMVPKPLSPYGAGKLFGEALCSAYSHSYGMETVALRFANVYGPYSDHKTSVIAEFIRRAKQGRPLEIYGDGSQTRDFIHARDIARAIGLALTASSSDDNIFGEVYQIATGMETSIKDLAQAVVDLRDEGIDIHYKDSRKGEIQKNFSDITKVKELLKFQPAVELTQGLQEVWDRYE